MSRRAHGTAAARFPALHAGSRRNRWAVLFAPRLPERDPSILPPRRRRRTPPWLFDHLGMAVGSVVIVFASIRTAVPDSYLPLFFYPGRLLSIAAGGWDPAEDLGHRSSGSQAYAPLALTFRALEALGAGPLVSERVWVATVLFVSASGTYWLSRTFWEHQHRAAGLVAAALYVGSPYMVLNLSGVTVLLLPYAVTPWVALGLVHAARHRAISGVVAAALASLPALGVNPPLFLIMLSAAVGIAVAEAVRHSGAASRCGLVIFGAFVCILINLWWLLPFLASISAGGADAFFVTDPISVGGSQSSFLEVLRQTGLWSLYHSYGGESYYASAAYLRSRFVVIGGSLAPVAFLAYVARTWGEARSKVLLLVLLVSVPLAVSVYPASKPTLTGRAYQWLYDSVFIFRSFRSNYKWVAVISLLFALVIPAAIASKRCMSDRLVVGWLQRAVPLFLVPLYLFPLFGNRIWMPQQRLGELPQYWRDAGAWLTAHPQEGRALFLPMQGFSAYTWGRPSGDVAPAVTTRKVLTPHIGAAYPSEVTRFLQLIAAAPSDATVPFARILTLLKVRFVVQRNDVDQQRYGTPSNAAMSTFLQTSPGLRLARTFGQLDVYEVTDTPAYGRVLWSPTMNQVVTDDYSLRSAVNAAVPGSLNVFLVPQVSLAPGVTATSTSTFGENNQDFGAAAALDGDPASAWVPAPQAVRPRLDLTFPRRALRVIRISGRRNGVDAIPTALVLSVGGAERTVPMVDGIAIADLGGIMSDRLRVGILAVGPGDPNAGIAEIDPGFDVGTRLSFPEVDLSQPSIVDVDFLQAGRGGLLREIPTRGESRLTGEVEVKGPLDGSTTPIESYLMLDGAQSVTTSSIFGGDPSYAGLWALVQDGVRGWVPDRGGVGEWWQVDFGSPRSVPSVSFRARANGADGEVAEVELSDGERSLGRRLVKYDSSGSATVKVDAVIRSLRITLKRSTLPGTNIGFRAVGIPGVAANRIGQKVDLDLPKGSLSLQATPSPELDDVIFGAGVLKLGFDIDVGAGLLSFRPQLESLLRLSKLAMRSAQRPQPLQVLPLASSQPTAVSVADSVGPGYLVLDESADPLWQASPGITPIDARAGGFAKLWRVPSGSSPPRLVFRDESHWRLGACLTIAQLLAGLLFLCWGRWWRHRSF